MIEQQDHIDFSTVPQSKGLGRGTLVLLIVGVIAIFAIGGASAFSSGYGHMWPSTHTERMNLGSMPQ
jgi:hypothetical protein